MNFTVIDFETYYDQEYSLKKLTTEEYIRDPRFKIHCVGVINSEGTRVVFTNNFAHNLRPFMSEFVICQHAQFDGLIMSHHLGIYPAYIGDTLSMARSQLQFLKSHSLEALAKYYGLPQKTIDYNAFKGNRDLDYGTMKMLTEGCLHDCDITHTIARKLLETFPMQELEIVDKTLRMFTEPCLVLDAPRTTKELERVRAAKAHALQSLGVTKDQLQSAGKFSELLVTQGVSVPMKYSEKQKKEVPALAKTDEGMKALLEHENDTIAALAAARLGEKSTLMESRCERLLGMHSRGYLTVYQKYHGAHTGRSSGGDGTNFLNFTRGSELRKSIRAPEGYKLVVADKSQVECRLVNWFAGQKDIVQAFREGRDLYSELASKFYGITVNKKDYPEERNFGKEVELACGFNMGWLKLQRRVLQKLNKQLTDEEAKKAIDIYRSSHPYVCALWRRFQEVIENMGKGLLPYKIGCVTIDGYRIIMPGGTFLDYTGMYYDGESYRLGKSKIYGGLVVENIIQKLGVVLLANDVITISEKYDYKLCTTTYDEVVYIVPLNDNTAFENVLRVMKSSPEWCKDLPLSAEGFESESYDK